MINKIIYVTLFLMISGCHKEVPVLVGKDDDISSFVGKLIKIRGEYIHRKVPSIIDIQVGYYPLEREGDKIEATGILKTKSLNEKDAQKLKNIFPNMKAGTFYFLEDPLTDELAIPILINEE